MNFGLIIGIMAPPFALTKDGIETQFGTNHVGHFLFTTTLIPAFEKAATPRIVNLSSYAQFMSHKEGIDFENINNPTKYSVTERYGQSKLANVLFTKGLVAHYPKIVSNCVHPGVVHTELLRGPTETYTILRILKPLVSLFSRLALLTPQQGSFATLYAATSTEIDTEKIQGQYIIPYGKVAEKVHPLANDEAMVEKLWKFTQDLVNEKLNQQ